MIYHDHRGLFWASVSIPTVLLPWVWWLGLILLAVWAVIAWKVR